MRKKRFGFSLRKEYLETWNYIKESKNFIFSIIILFFIVGVMGFFLNAPEAVMEKLKEYLSNILSMTEGMNQIQLIGFIFWNNLKIGFIGLFFGLLLGIFPLLTTIGNGYFIGVISRMAVNEQGIFVLWRLLPHGIFELPAIFISLGLGLKLGTFLFKDDLKKYFINYSLNSLKAFFLFVFPLLLLAAIIEGTFIAFS